METLLNKYKLVHQRIAAVDGSMVGELEKYCIPNNKLTRAENACTTSHLLAMKYFVENIPDDRIIIFEDDVSFEFLQYIPFNWSELDKNFPVNYEVIQLAITYEKGSVGNILVKTVPEMTYYCSAAYLITKKAATNLLAKYYAKNLGKFVLSTQLYATADAMIASTGFTYSIPIFTYQTIESTIHPQHLLNHNRTKTQQLNLWKYTMSNIHMFNPKNYFSKFPK